jgi:hypothetical protein
MPDKFVALMQRSVIKEYQTAQMTGTLDYAALQDYII